MIASPTSTLIVPSKTDLALAKKGLLSVNDQGKMAQITSAGLRVLADEIDAGRVRPILDDMVKDASEARKRLAAAMNRL